MGTISILDSTGATQTAALVANTGSATSANSLPVVIASDQAAITTTSVGAAAAGAAISGNPVLGAGSDGTNARALLTDTGGRQIVVPYANGAAVASANPLPVAQPADTTPATANITVVDSGSTVASGQNGQSIITGTPTANSAASFAYANENTINWQISGTWTGTLQCEISMDGGTTWVPTTGFIRGTTFIASAFTANAVATVNVAGTTNLRLRATAAVTGTATVKVIESGLVGGIYLSGYVQAKIGDGTNVVTVKAASTAPVATDTAQVVAISPNNSGTAGQYVPNALLVVSSSFTRPANTTAYAANQEVSNNTTAGSVTPLSWSVLRAAGDAFQIQRVRISKTNTSLTNASFKLDLFEASPTVTVGDGGAWNNGSGTLACNQGLTWIGSVSITMGTAGSDGCNGSLALAAPIVTSPGSGTTIYGILSALAAYTPGSAETFKVTLEGVRS